MYEECIAFPLFCKKKKKKKKASLGIGWVQPQLLFVCRKWVCNLETFSTLSNLNGKVSETDTRIPRHFTSLRFAQKDREKTEQIRITLQRLSNFINQGCRETLPPPRTNRV